MIDIQVTTVSKDLYYHEVAYVRGLEKSNAELVAALRAFVVCFDQKRNHGWDMPNLYKAKEQADAALAGSGK